MHLMNAHPDIGYEVNNIIPVINNSVIPAFTENVPLYAQMLSEAYEKRNKYVLMCLLTEPCFLELRKAQFLGAVSRIIDDKLSFRASPNGILLDHVHSSFPHSVTQDILKRIFDKALDDLGAFDSSYLLYHITDTNLGAVMEFGKLIAMCDDQTIRTERLSYLVAEGTGSSVLFTLMMEREKLAGVQHNHRDLLLATTRNIQKAGARIMELVFHDAETSHAKIDEKDVLEALLTLSQSFRKESSGLCFYYFKVLFKRYPHFMLAWPDTLAKMSNVMTCRGYQKAIMKSMPRSLLIFRSAISNKLNSHPVIISLMKQPKKSTILRMLLHPNVTVPSEQSALFNASDPLYLEAMHYACSQGHASTLGVLFRQRRRPGCSDVLPNLPYEWTLGPAVKCCHKGKRNHRAVLAMLLEELNRRALEQDNTMESRERMQQMLDRALIDAAEEGRMTAVRMLLGKLRKEDKRHRFHLIANVTHEAVEVARTRNCVRIGRVMQQQQQQQQSS